MFYLECDYYFFFSLSTPPRAPPPPLPHPHTPKTPFHNQPKPHALI